MIKKFESLIKFSKEQSKLIKQLKDKIDNFIKTKKNVDRKFNFPSQSTMASQVAVFARWYLASNVQIRLLLLV